MKRWLSVLLSAALLLGTLVAPVSAETRLQAPVTPFTDVVGTPYAEAVGYLYAAGLASGTSPTTFNPFGGVTRAQMATFVVRALGKEKDPVPAGTAFSDVPSSHWAYGPVMKAASLGIVKGTTDTTFAPDAPVTYAQAVTMLLRALGYEKQLQGSFPVPQVLKAKELGWLEGVSFDVSGNANRGDVALMLAAAVFGTPHADTGLTLSQSVIRYAAQVKILPEVDTLTPGETQLQSVGVDWYGKTFPLTGVTWLSDAGTGFTLSADGLLKVTTAEKVTVKFIKDARYTDQTYNIVTSLAITGAESGVKPGSSITLKAEGVTPKGSKVPVRAQWKVKSGSAAITNEGVLTANAGGKIVVEATAGTLKREVEVAAAAGLTINSPTNLLAIGQSTKLTATVTDGSGGTVNLPIAWSVVGGSGTITADGTLTAGNSGPIVVQARAGSLTAEATIELLVSIVVKPENSNVSKGGTLQFTAKARKVDGTEVDITPKWTSTGSVGIMGTNGLLIGTVVGTGQAVAEYYGLKGSTYFTVAGEAVAIRVDASRNSVPANGKTTSTITATLVDGRGIPVTGTAESVTFNMSSTNLGTLSVSNAKFENGKASVTFTPSEQAGTVIIVASAPGTNLVSGSTTISTVVPIVSRVRLEAYPPTIAADNVSRTQITATLEDSTGAPIKNTSGSSIFVSLYSSGVQAGVLETTQIGIAPTQTSATVSFRATVAVGTTSITGTAIYPVTGTQVQSVIVGPATKLRIRPGIEETKADGTSLMTVQVEVQDSNGYVRTGDNTTVVNLVGTNPENGHVVTTAPLSVVNGVATFRLTTVRAGTYKYVASTTSSPAIAAAEAQGTFVAGAATRVELGVEPSNTIAADGVTVLRLIARIVDTYGNVVKSAANPITFSKSANQNATSMVNDTTLTPINGVATLELKATAYPGTDTFIATASGLTTSGSQTITSRITGSAHKIRVQAPSPSTITAGQSTVVQVHVMDSLNNLVTGASGRIISLTSTSPTAVINSPQPTVGGVATFTITDTRVGTWNLSATATGLENDTTIRQVVVNPGQVAQIKLVASPEGLAADGTSSLTITGQATDTYGNSVPWSSAVQLSINNTTSGRLSSNYLYTGSSVVLFSTTTPGSITVTGTASNVAVTPLTIPTYVPAAPARVVVEEVAPFTVSDAFLNPTAIRVKILDVNGNLATGVSSGALLSAAGIQISGNSGLNTMRITASATTGLMGFTPNGVTTGSNVVVNGVATFQFTNTKAETVLFTPVVYYNGQLLPASGARITTRPGVANQIAVSPENPVLTSQVAMPLTITAAVADRFGNPVSSESDTLVFTPSTTSYLTFPETTSVDTVNGMASITVTSRPSSGGATTVTIRSTKTGLTRTVTVSADLPPAKPTVRATNINGTSSIVPVSDGAVRIRVDNLSRQSIQTVLVYVNGALRTAYTAPDLSVQDGGIAPYQTSWQGYVRTTDFVPGTNSITVILSNGLGLSPASDSVTVTVQ